jgi:flavorubredoxin
LVWRSNLQWVLERYVKWSTGENEEGVVIAYGSMYGNTALMADIIARGVAEAGVKNIKIYDVAKTEVSHIIGDIWKYKGCVIGACAHYGSVFPNMTLLLHELTEFKPKNKVYGVFGGMSWGGGGVKYINGVVEKNQWECPVESVEVKGAPYRPEDVERLYNLGKAIGEAVKNN